MQHLRTLDEHGKLVRVNRSINKDTSWLFERWQFGKTFSGRTSVFVKRMNTSKFAAGKNLQRIRAEDAELVDTLTEQDSKILGFNS